MTSRRPFLAGGDHAVARHRFESAYAILADRTVRSWGAMAGSRVVGGVRPLIPGVFGAAGRVDVPVLQRSRDPVEGPIALPGNRA